MQRDTNMAQGSSIYFELSLCRGTISGMSPSPSLIRPVSLWVSMNADGGDRTFLFRALLPASSFSFDEVQESRTQSLSDLVVTI